MRKTKNSKINLISPTPHIREILLVLLNWLKNGDDTLNGLTLLVSADSEQERERIRLLITRYYKRFFEKRGTLVNSRNQTQILWGISKEGEKYVKENN